MTPPSDKQSPPPLPTPAPSAKGRSNAWRSLLFASLVAGLVIVGPICGLLFFTNVGKYLRYSWGIQFRDFKLVHITNHERVLSAGRQVIADPTLYRAHKWLPSNPPKVYHLDPSDPQLPEALRSLHATVITVTEDVLIIRLDFGWGRNSGLVILPPKYAEASGYTPWKDWREGYGPWRKWPGLRELREGVFYFTETFKN